MPACDTSSTPVRAALALVAALAATAVAAPPAQAGAPTQPQRPSGAMHPGLAAKLSAPHPGRGASAARKPVADQWIVELDAPPLARYRGGIAGLDATAPAATGRRLDRGSADARAYEGELRRRQARVIAAAVPGVEPTAEYRTAFNGFAAKLDGDEVRALRAADGVRRVVRERFFELEAVEQAAVAPAKGGGIGGIGGSEAELLGLPGGLWKQLGGAASAGRGVVVGIVDSGITPESASFADAAMPAPPSSWHGACRTGESFPAEACTDKLVGARWFADGIGAEFLPEESYISPRDETGHGTHVAATAAGNAGVDPLIGFGALGVDRVTGIAPAAHVAAYKACWVTGFCSNVDVVAAIDSAVADGVDVLNLSLGGEAQPGGGPDPTELALLNADAAGVFVAVAAGNAGTYPGALGSPASAPWTTAVGATTGARTFRTTIEARGPRGAHARVPASTSAPALRDARLVDASSFSRPGDDVLDDPRYCVGGMTPERVRGALVICDAYAPIDLVSGVLRAAGAAGMVLPVDMRFADDPAVASLVPSLFVDESDAPALRRAAASGATASYEGASATRWQAHRVAWFSSRGPGTDSGVLRPDVAAPGVNVLAAYSPDTYRAQVGVEGREQFNVLSGTSMASPIVAGAGALLTQLHPGWSPAAIRSALVTTAQPAVDSDGDGRAPHVAAGAGRIDPTAAARPGLVVTPSEGDYRAFAAGELAARDLELPSVSLDDAMTQLTVQRTVTSVEAGRTRWSARVEAPGMQRGSIGVTPSSFAIDAGARRALRIDTRVDRGSPAFQDATIVLTNVQTGRQARMPLSIHNPGIEPPKRIEVAASGADGNQAVTAKISATVSGVAHGLAAPDTREATTGEMFPGVQEATIPVEIAPGTALYSAEVSAHDGIEFFNAMLYRDLDEDGVVDPTEPLAEGVDLTRTDYTRVDVISPPAGRYLLWATGASDTPVRFGLSSWTVTDPQPDDPAPGPGIVLGGDPQHAFPAAERPFDLHWSSVGGSQPLRGIVLWYDGDRADPARLLGSSVVEVTPGATG